eukprot:TRINITY_DN71994_c0_g1_i1.p1 TRINITY_DN71994_c0_g1~~TRINITY_DN71994_c0_g1_i1.p1  ORF type:complete len:919 (+),score=132.20 TRINITY_DN71994_c0_g1_i1:95-2851(+)
MQCASEEIYVKKDTMPQDEADDPSWRCAYSRYFAGSFIAAGCPTLLSILLFSDMGFGKEVYDLFNGSKIKAYMLGGSAVAILVILYLLDFFWPPHLPNQYFSLYENDKILGRSFLLLAAGLLYLATFCYAEEQPMVPIICTALLSLVSTLALRAASNTTRTSFRSGVMPEPTTSISVRQSMIKAYAGSEQDARRFYAATTCAFLMLGMLTVAVWAVWAVNSSVNLGNLEWGNNQNELLYVRLVCPLATAVANLMFGCIVYLRVRLANTYDQGEVLLDVIANAQPSDETADSFTRECLISRHLDEDNCKLAFMAMSKSQQQAFAKQHLHNIEQVSRVIKLIGCALILAIGTVYIAFLLVTESSHLANLILYFLYAGFIAFAAFVCVSFRRLMNAMSEWCAELPMFRLAVSVMQNDWVRAFVIFAFSPVVLVLLGLSFANQMVRRARGLYSQIPAPPIKPGSKVPPFLHSDASDASTPFAPDFDPERRWLTERVIAQVDQTKDWRWIIILSRVYIAGLLSVLYTICPIFLNVFLSWLSGSLRGLHFGIIIATDIVAGMVCFLLPPVPGVPVYVFSGIVISESCPLGFYWGCVIAILVGFVMKLMACAMQQKLIGELLGKSNAIRSAVGVNRPVIRAVEAVMRRPGLSVGKVAILCGGPDWPTSVLAGILKLSLWECELGTVPVIAFVAPCALAGAFYLKQDVSPLWKRLSSLLMLLTFLIATMLQLMAAFAFQNEFDKNSWELTRPLMQNLDLDWIQYREDEIAKSFVVRWLDLPCWLRVMALYGAIIETCVGQGFFWLPSYCFGQFSVTDDIKTFRLWVDGRSGLIKTPGLLGLMAFAGGFVFYFILVRYMAFKCHEPWAAKARELDRYEESWKEERRALCRDTAQRGPSLRETLTGVPVQIGQADGIPDMSLRNLPTT